MFYRQKTLEDEAEDEHLFTIAPPYLEQDDKHILFSNAQGGKQNVGRFKSFQVGKLACTLLVTYYIADIFHGKHVHCI